MPAPIHRIVALRHQPMRVDPAHEVRDQDEDQQADRQRDTNFQAQQRATFRGRIPNQEHDADQQRQDDRDQHDDNDDFDEHESSILRTAAEIRSEENTSELQSLMSISYAVFCMKKNKN